MVASEAKPQQNYTRDSPRTVLAINLGTEHITYERAGFRNVLNEMCKSFEGRDQMCKSFEGRDRRAALLVIITRNAGGYPAQGYRRGY